MSAPTQTYDPMGFGDEAQQKSDAAAEANGVSTTVRVRKNHWGTSEVHRFYFPDQDDVPESERDFIEFKKMNEGERARYQKETSDPVLVHRGSGDARMKVDPARDREALIRSAVCGWNLWKDNRPAPFNDSMVAHWYKNADPDVIDELEKAIRAKNKWLRSEMSLKDARAELERVTELVKTLEDDEAEKASSRNK